MGSLFPLLFLSLLLQFPLATAIIKIKNSFYFILYLYILVSVAFFFFYTKVSSIHIYLRGRETVHPYQACTQKLYGWKIEHEHWPHKTFWDSIEKIFGIINWVFSFFFFFLGFNIFLIHIFLFGLVFFKFFLN